MFPVVVVRDFPSQPKAKNQSCKISVTTCHTAILTPTLQALLSSQFAFDLLIVSLDHATPYISLHRTPLHLNLVYKYFHMFLLCSRKKTDFCAVLSSRAPVFVSYLM
jgi:hypothetical protein